MFSFYIPLICSLITGLVITEIIITEIIIWVTGNLQTHTPEWHNQKLIEWLKRPLPMLSDKHYKKIRECFPSEEWEKYPYLLIDAICKESQTSDDVVKWAIYYTIPNCEKDKEYMQLAVKNV